jgi:hydrogenase maturation protease
MKTLILGIGNILLGDDGVGVHVVRSLRKGKTESGGSEYMDGGTLSFTLAGAVEEADRLIVIDAAQLHAAPGTVRLFEGEVMDRFIMRNHRSSVHEVSLADLLVMTHLSGGLSQQRALIGIQPESMDWSDRLSDAVSRVVPRACKLAERLDREWKNSVV